MEEGLARDTTSNKRAVAEERERERERRREEWGAREGGGTRAWFSERGLVENFILK
jgi:hypothetical protein